MNERYSPTQIIRLPHPRPIEVNGRWERNWTISLCKPTVGDALKELGPLLSSENFAVTVTIIDEGQVQVVVTNEIEPLSDENFIVRPRAMLRALNDSLGALEFIEGIPASLWPPLRQRFHAVIPDTALDPVRIERAIGAVRALPAWQASECTRACGRPLGQINFGRVSEVRLQRASAGTRAELRVVVLGSDLVITSDTNADVLEARAALVSLEIDDRYTVEMALAS